MTNSCSDLTIEGVLADPMIRATMRADRVDPRAFEDLLRSSARQLQASVAEVPAGIIERARRSACGSICTW